MKTVSLLPATLAARAVGLQWGRAFLIVGLSAQAIAQEGVPPPRPTIPPLPVVTLTEPATPARHPGALVWDADTKEIATKPGDATAAFTFWFTNASPNEVTINAVRASCGCTTTKLPAVPWKIAPGTNGPIEVSVDLRGKSGVIAKAVTVDSTAGLKSLGFKINIPVEQTARVVAEPAFALPGTPTVAKQTAAGGPALPKAN